MDDMKLVGFFISAVLLTMAQAIAVESSVIVTPKGLTGSLEFEFQGRLGRTFEFSDCKFVSGLTCTVKLEQGQKLPSRVFVKEIYVNGEHHGKEWLLIYPKL